ncbi:MAG: SpoIVB peptidase S55 domain-containing protein [Holophagaceae bacterium]
MNLALRLPTAAALLLAPALAPVLAAQATLGLHEIQPGMRGYGRTVFRGSKIERFEFEVLGVQRNMAPGRSLILVKASGGPLAETGILAGMSGSPCYIDGKLVGALSTGFTFEKEAIGGITPIADMTEQLRDVPEGASSRTPLVLPKVEPPKVLKAALTGGLLPFRDLAGEEGARPEPPMLVTGAPLGTEAKAFLDGLPLQYMAAPTLAPAPGGEASPLEPGGMVSIALVQGDMEMAASGTITQVSGKRVLLFGHQLLNLGPVDLPMWSASVAYSMPSYLRSFKLATPVAPVGAVRMDRSTGVAGVLGAEARMIPLRVGLNLGGRRTVNFRFELMDHPFLTPFLAATVLTQALNAQVRGLGFQSLALQGNIKVAGHAPIQLENVVADLNPGRLSAFVGGILQALTTNPFERPEIEGISLTIKAEERLDLTTIAGARTLKARVRRGESLPVLVALQNIQGVREQVTLNIPVSASAQKGKAVIMVGDGFSLAAADPDEKAVDVASLNDVTRLLNGALRNNHAYALLVQAQPGAGLRGSRIEGIPPSVAALLGADGVTFDNRLQRRIVGRAWLPLEREVKGLVQLDVEIE